MHRLTAINVVSLSIMLNVPFALSQGRMLLETKLWPSDVVGGDNASNPAIDGNWAIVGSPGASYAGYSAAGAAYTFEHTPSGWIQHAKLIPSDPVDILQFGWSAAVSGDTFVVGAITDTRPAGNLSGSAYVFVRTNDDWSEQAKLIANSPTSDEAFGSSVAISGNTVVIGCPFWSGPTGPNTGRAIVFARSAGIWTQQAILLASSRVDHDEFGYSVSISGDTIVVGAHYHNTGLGDNAGAAYVFRRQGGIWSEEATLVGSSISVDSVFGSSVSTDNDTAVIGAPGESHNGLQQPGACYVFARTGNDWSETQHLIANDPGNYANFGRGVCVSGNNIVVGADNRYFHGTQGAGAVYWFQNQGGIWIQTDRFLETNSSFSLGRSVAISGGLALAGSPGDGLTGNLSAETRRGSTYAFARFVPYNPAPCPEDVDSNGKVDLSDLAQVLSKYGLDCP